MNSKVLTLLGFASKACKLKYGMKNTLESIKKGEVKLVVCAATLSKKSEKEIKFFAAKEEICVATLENVSDEELSAAVGRKCGMVSVCDTGFADAISKIIGGYANDQ